MTLRNLEHILRAAGAVTDETQIAILGSQAVLGSCPEPPPPLSMSMEADAYPLSAPGKADLIDGAIGELSPFHETFGYYAHGITPDSVVLPEGWEKRLVRLESPRTMGVTGWCLSLEDLAVSKCAAGREKDIAFLQVLRANRMISADAVSLFLETIPVEFREKARSVWRSVCSGT